MAENRQLEDAIVFAFRLYRSLCLYWLLTDHRVLSDDMFKHARFYFEQTLEGIGDFGCD